MFIKTITNLRRQRYSKQFPLLLIYGQCVLKISRIKHNKKNLSATKDFNFYFQQWGNVSLENDKNPQIDEFLEHLEMFITNLLSAVDNMEGQITLAENGCGPQIDGLSSPTDFQAAGMLYFSAVQTSYFDCVKKKHYFV